MSRLNNQQRKELNTSNDTIFTIVGKPFVSHVEQKEVYRSFNLSAILSNNCHGQYNDLTHTGFIKVMGYKYDLRHLLAKYVVSTVNHIGEYYSINKTTLRKSLSDCGLGKINYIMEIK